MSSAKEIILHLLPYFLQDKAISWYNTRLYKKRQSGIYWDWRNYFVKWENARKDEWKIEEQRRLGEFLEYACLHSSWYKRFSRIDFNTFPLLEKKNLIQNLSAFATIDESFGIPSLTGGTTGASMKVIYTQSDIQERHALLDHFRAANGYTLGDKVAWFSGKNLATHNDVRKGRCYRDDQQNNIRFFSTFFINRKNFDIYWNALREFRPTFIVGFPSSVLDIAMYAREQGLKADWNVEVMFPTAETVLPVHREVIGDVFGCKLVNQYASSEGAPFILECKHGRLHIHPLSGVFEVIDENGCPSREGEMIVTSFSTRGTPLIRYRVGDRVRLADPDDRCECGSSYPLVDWIDGRNSDFVFSQENGRVNLGNLSNSTKDVVGIICFQVEQNAIHEILVRVVNDKRFDHNEAEKFEHALRLRVGAKMRIRFEQVEEIQRERSGKFRIVINNLV
ncbi:MAG: phenylacetate--CoA ligase family protein [Fluviibacter phosphoraccumulans]